MKKTLLALLVLSGAFVLLSACNETAAKKDAAPAAAAVETAPAGPAPDVVLVSDFEDSSKQLITYAGPKSKMTADFSTEKAHSGKQSAKVTQQTADWAGALVAVDANTGNFTGLTTFHMWVYGDNTKASFNIDLEDAKKEQFRYTVNDTFNGWKELVIPMSEFKSRTDWQAADAKVDGKMDFPLMTVQFCTISGGAFTLYFDDISVTKK